MEHNAITVESTVNVPIGKAWEYWNNPEHITKWCQASDDWHAPYAENDLREGGTFKTTMAAKDGSFSFDFGGTYDLVKEPNRIAYTMGDGRKVEVLFNEENGATRIVETFDPESMNSAEMQRAGWQAILDNFKRYTENN
ncbi:MAG: SRPBCC family protein [Solitalea sp.]